MLVSDSLTVICQTYNRQFNGQGLLSLVKFGRTLLAIAHVFEVQIQVVQPIDCENQCAIVDIELCTLHAFAKLRIDCYSQRLR